MTELQPAIITTLEALVKSSQNLATAAKANAEASNSARLQSQRAERAARRRELRSGIAMFMLAAVILVLLVSAQISRSQISSCTLPSGKCYKDGQDRIVQVIEQLDKHGIYRVACSSRYQSLAVEPQISAINACVSREIALHQNDTP